MTRFKFELLCLLDFAEAKYKIYDHLLFYKN